MHSRTHWSHVYSTNVDELLTANAKASINNDGSRAFRRWLDSNPPASERVPLLEFWLIEFAANIPSSAMVRHF